MFDEFIYRYRFLIGGILIAVILVGSGVLIWERNGRLTKDKETSEMAVLKEQNELLRKQLSDKSSQGIAGASTSNDEVAGKININSADVAELDKLPGIGPARAADIIAYREKNGGFKSTEELKEIKGIGDATFEKMKDMVTVGE